MKRDTFAMTQDDFITFLGTLASGRIGPKIANAVITQFGGWQEFKDNGMDLFIRGGHFLDRNKTKRQKLITGWDSQAVTSEFYTKNKADILELAKSRTDSQESQTVVELVSEFDSLDGEYDLDAVAVGMHVPECAEYPVVSSALACFAANEVTFAYDIFKAVHGNGLSA